jgi:hypothetical protein
MVSSFTTNKSLEKPGNGDYVDTWNVPVNGDLDIIDSALGGNTFLNVTGVSDTTLVSTEYRKLILTITGTVTGLPVYRIPSGTGGIWVVRNGSSGIVNVAGPSPDLGVPVSAGTVNTVYSDGTVTRLITDPTLAIEAILATRDVIAGVALTGGGPLSADVTLTADQASAANWRDNIANKLLNANAVWSSMSETTLTDGATISWDMVTGFDFIATLGGNRTIANPTNTKVGQKGRLILQQDATGSRTVTWGSNYKFPNGVKPILSTAANSVDVLYYDVRSATYIIMSFAGRSFS